MPAPRMSMRKLKEALRLKWACGLSHRQISRAIGKLIADLNQRPPLVPVPRRSSNTC
ncbi:hypothetical protein B0O95_105207 [Mycetohabitans endofungorum]|uniref:Transposase n=1 Tax=Mycetohabitans endofungorum TaxID=417203 RepID=A0A2P5KBB9_9BURK|nr:hypothetical protein B0O95_105207 [Mycetohabitans endofungorum]